MDPNPQCPVCRDRRWAIVGARTYRLETSQKWWPSARSILFDLWLPGERVFKAKFAGCRTCGMMIYLPRPTAEDMQARFRGFNRTGDFVPSKGESRRRTRQRAQRIFDILQPHISKPLEDCRVLDFGGGDGRLMRALVEAGAQCELIDYCTRPIAGVRHIGRTEADLSSGETYDAIICSHVVEHLEDPRGILTMLSQHLKQEGVIYVEVPVEVRKAMPAGIEPVTHINFFIPETLKALLQRAGYDVARCSLTPYPHPNGSWALCAGAIAARGGGAAAETDGFAALQAYLKPSAGHVLRVNAMLWRGFPGRLRNKLAITWRQLRAGPGERANGDTHVIRVPNSAVPPLKYKQYDFPENSDGPQDRTR